MEQSSLSQPVLHDVAVQQQQHNQQHNIHNIHIQHGIHDIHNHPPIDHLHHINHNDNLFRPFFRDENHFIYSQQDIFAHQHHQHHQNNAPSAPSPPQQQQPSQTQQPADRSLDLSNIDDEPLYVNAKQYFRILKRRVARTRLEEVHRLSRQRKPYLHESRHKHAMRRPRGPGGRFLTAEEIAAQKQAAQDEPGPSTSAVLDHDPDDEPEDDESKPDESSVSPAPESEVFMSHQPPSDPMGIINMAYRPNISLLSQTSPQSQVQSLPSSALPSSQPQSRPPSSPITVFPQQQQTALQDKGNPVTLTSPYPVQMHHVPHPHAHARHHHSNVNSYIYSSDGVSPGANPEIQRQTEDMIQFGAGPPNS